MYVRNTKKKLKFIRLSGPSIARILVRVGALQDSIMILIFI